MSNRVAKTNMSRGDRVTVYHDPWTAKEPEGVAVLVEFLHWTDTLGSRTIERWRVRFNDGTFERAVAEDDRL